MKGFFKNVILLLSSGSCGAYVAMRNQELSPEGGVYEVLRRLSADDFVCGGITEIKGSQNCPTIDSLARFAVHQHNNNKNAILESVKMVPQEKEFVKVVSAKQQLVAGMLYYITLEAKVGEKVNVYEAKVWERPWLELKELTEFKFVGEAPPPSIDSTNRNFFIDFFKF